MRILASTLLLLFVPGARIVEVSPSVSTEAVANYPADVAIWRHPADSAQTLLLGVNRAAAPAGALLVFGLGGKTRQTIGGLDAPDGVDAEGNLVAVVERARQQLRLFRIDPSSGTLSEAGALPVFAGEAGDRAQATGVSLYRRKKDGALFAILSRKAGPTGAYLWQYRLEDDGKQVAGRKVREFGQFTAGRANEIGAVAVDDAEGFVYYSDKNCCVHKYNADPDTPGGGKAELARHATDKFEGPREGIAVTQFWLIVTEKMKGHSQYHVYAKRGQALRPLFVLRGPADSTEGIEVADAALPGFPNGFLAAMNSAGRNFQLFALKQRY